MVPGFGQQPRFIVTIQPAGAVFNPPAPITLPNVDGLRPREVTEMYSFDHDIGSFVADRHRHRERRRPGGDPIECGRRRAESGLALRRQSEFDRHGRDVPHVPDLRGQQLSDRSVGRSVAVLQRERVRLGLSVLRQQLDPWRRTRLPTFAVSESTAEPELDVRIRRLQSPAAARVSSATIRPAATTRCFRTITCRTPRTSTRATSTIAATRPAAATTR